MIKGWHGDEVFGVVCYEEIDNDKQLLHNVLDYHGA